MNLDEIPPDELAKVKEIADLFLFEIFVNIKAKNSGLTPKMFVDMKTVDDWAEWTTRFREMLEAGWLK